MMETQGPISFSAWDMARILAHEKAQTRRPVKPQPVWETDWPDRLSGLPPEFRDATGRYFKSPYHIGDLRWCREPWRIISWDGDFWRLDIEYRDGTVRECTVDSERDEDWTGRVWCQCDDDMEKAGVKLNAFTELYDLPADGKLPTRWRPGMFMPREFSRAMVEIESVRGERVQRITEDDALAEGIHLRPVAETHMWCWDDSLTAHAFWIPVEAYRSLWNSLYGHKPPYRWDLDPFCWVYGFRLVVPAP